MEMYTTGTGQHVLVHNKAKCHGQTCCIHDPSEHAMKDFPTHWRDDRKLMERICPHGIGHPDPDQFEFLVKTLGIQSATVEFIHGCDGCCT